MVGVETCQPQIQGVHLLLVIAGVEPVGVDDPGTAELGVHQGAGHGDVVGVVEDQVCVAGIALGVKLETLALDAVAAEQGSVIGVVVVEPTGRQLRVPALGGDGGAVADGTHGGVQVQLLAGLLPGQQGYHR